MASEDTYEQVLSQCGVKPGDDERTTISKKISWILRHGAKRASLGMAVYGINNLAITDDGWVKISELLKTELMSGVSHGKFMGVVHESNQQKTRYEVKNDNIRATRNRGKGDRPDRAGKSDRESRGGKGRKGKGQSERSHEPPPAPPSSSDDASSGMRHDAPSFVPAHMKPPTPPVYPGGFPAFPPFGYPIHPLAAMGLMNPAMMGAQPGVAGYPGFPMSPFAGGAMQAASMGGRYRGLIKSFNAERGFGFIECAEAKAEFNRDVFLHKAHIGNLEVGSWVTFTIDTNKRDMPQAKDLQLLGVPGQNPGFTPGGKGGRGKGKAKGGGRGGGKKEKGAGKEKPKPAEGEGDSKVEPVKVELGAAVAAEAPAAEAAPAAAEAPAAEGAKDA